MPGRNWKGPNNPKWAGGRRDHPLYHRWWKMILRCTNPEHWQWPNYGGRGITVCDRWRYDFWAYVADVGNPPGPDYTLDRIDNDGNYEPGNVRWATRAQQNNNKRKHYRRRTTCRRGHPVNKINTYTSPKTGKRTCRVCINEANHAKRRSNAL